MSSVLSDLEVGILPENPLSNVTLQQIMSSITEDNSVGDGSFQSGDTDGVALDRRY